MTSSSTVPTVLLLLRIWPIRRKRFGSSARGLVVSFAFRRGARFASTSSASEGDIKASLGEIVVAPDNLFSHREVIVSGENDMTSRRERVSVLKSEVSVWEMPRGGSPAHLLKRVYRRCVEPKVKIDGISVVLDKIAMPLEEQGIL